MFTGLVESTGRVRQLHSTRGALRLVIEAPGLAGRWKTGDSIAVNGVCLTALPVGDGGEGRSGFAADLAQETIERTSLQHLAAESVVNLELPTPAGAPLGGHVVQGHVDGTGTAVSLLALHPEDLDSTDWRLTLDLPPQLAAQVLPQGSITVQGISLTVARLDDVRVEIAVIPHTYKSTNLRFLHPGDKLNIETDVLAKYAARAKALGRERADASRQEDMPSEWLTPAYLLANGY